MDIGKLFKGFFLWVFLSSVCWGENLQVVKIRRLNIEDTIKISLIELELEGVVKWKNLFFEDHGSFLQLTLKNTQTLHPGSFYDSKNPLIEKIVLLQSDISTSLLRIYVSKMAGKVKKSSKINIFPNRLLISIDSKLQNNLTISSYKSAKIINQTTNTQKKEDNLYRYFRKISYYIAILSVVVIFGFFIRPFLRMRRSRVHTHGSIMKTLGSMHLNQKQKLAIVEVDGEKILLAISPDNVSYIKSIGQHTRTSPLNAIQPNPPPRPTKSIPRRKVLSSKKLSQLPNKSPAFTNWLKESSGKDIRLNTPPENSKKNTKEQATTPQSEQEKPKQSLKNTEEIKQAIDDVTCIIRKKLANLQNLP